MKTNSTQNGRFSKRIFRVLLPAFLLGTMSASAQITESMDTVLSTTSIAAYETANGFDNDSLTYSGTGDIRSTNPSTGYVGASGAANAFINTGKTFVISRLGTNACGGTLLTMSFGIGKSTTTENGSHMIVEYSTDGGFTWTGLTFAALPTGAGTSYASTYYLRTVSGLPVTCNLQIRFRNSATSGPSFRIDDINLSCGAPLVSVCSATITAADTNVFCAGDSVVLTANAGDSYLWSNGATTQSITVKSSGTYFVTVEHSCCFATSSGFYVLVHNDALETPVVDGVVSDDTICAGDSVTLSARTLARGLFFSQYQEGAGFDKAIEIFNGTGAGINLSDYQIRDFHNGACDDVTPTYTIALPNIVLADGAVFVVANPGHSLIGLGLTPDMTSNDLLYDGDDAVTLYNSATGEYVDIIGSICHDPGSAWTAPNHYRTQDRTLTRKPCVHEGIFVNPNLPGTSGFPTLAPEWLVDTTASITGFGSHTMDALSYSWSPATVPSTGAIVKAAPTVTTTYTVSGTYCDGCPFTDTVRVVVQDCGEGRLAAPKANTTAPVNASAYPNPFTGTVVINVNTPVEGLVKIEIVNMLGEKVAVLNNNVLAAGPHAFTWNGAAADGSQLPAGVYSCNIITGNTVQNIMIVKSAK